MDLNEFQPGVFSRHPWEISRIKSIKKILTPYIDKDRKVLDAGCGDCFAVTELFKDIDSRHIDAVDINLTDNQAAEFSKTKGISIHYKYDQLPKKFYDIILVLDVIEHVDDAVHFLRETISQFAAPGAVILITVPAFNSLYSSHDSFLGHSRRYNLKEIQDVLNRAGLNVTDSGYLFFLPLIARFAAVCFQRITKKTKTEKGIGGWNHGKSVSKIIELVLMTDNIISLFLKRMGLIIPGLTVWALCKKQQ